MDAYEKIRQLREEKKWSQEELATQLGLSTNGYAKIERGETRLTLPRLEQLAEIFEISILDLIQTDIKHLDYQIGNQSHINHGRDFTIYGTTEHKDLIQEIEKLKLIIQHQEQLLNQQARELKMAHKMLGLQETNG